MLSSHWMESQYSPSYREADKVSQFQVEGFQGIYEKNYKEALSNKQSLCNEVVNRVM